MISRTFSKVSFSCTALHWTVSLSSLILIHAERALFIPIFAELWITCRCKFDNSTTSKSTIVKRPIPAPARYKINEDPIPPAPTTSIELLVIDFCP